MDFTACPACASPRIHAPHLSDGMVPGGGELIYHVCPDCGFRGSPLQFGSVDDYMAYQQRVQAAAGRPEDAADQGASPTGASPAPAAAAAAWQAPDEARPEADAAARQAVSVLEVRAPRRSRGTAVFIALLGAVAAASGAGFAALALVQVRPLDAVLGLLTLGVGVAFLRVARRLWS
ncbi:MAG TPA: hypothetical protein VFH47_08465, partial [Candidatus Thermoplasmatota archaeon]|nr:hypothetical protein [Candidatus Thermoplasmatota archaeon]